ncbi:T9SS type B sorting domain-containing protein [Flavobacterium degerlachei]|uniref:T9SS type B sorting domain-containing protein n=1 Tax=Flavobacterium degerlachei TaxID=229203 RepID=UPI00158765BE|nr:T9SS type B sorting domain-containing protein [Flavobacterium degerlachei]
MILLYSFLANGQDFQWARQIKGISSDYADYANGLAVDSSENSYIIGNTESLLFDLDPTISGVNIIDNTNINHTFRGTYLIKVDSNGNYLWGKTFGSYQGSDSSYDVKIGTDGNIYALLTLQELNSSLSIIDSFIKIIKFSPDGTILSTITIPQNYGYNNNLYVHSFELDDQNNIFLNGYFIGNIILDTTNPLMNVSTNSLSSYILKINNGGDFVWVKQFDSNMGSEIAIRPDGNINLLLNNSIGYTLYNIDSIDNTIIWQKDFINQRQRTFHVATNGIVILGEKNYYDTIDVDPSSTVSNISGNNTSFIIFLNLNGTFIDSKQFYKPTNGDVKFTTVTTDSDGNYFFGGTFSDTVDMNPSNNTFNLTSNGYKGEAFYLKLDVNRNFESAIKLGDENPKLSPYNNCEYFRIKKIKIINNNNYLVGDFMWICDFDPSTTNQYTFNTVNSSTINFDGFILKLGSCDSSKLVGDIDQTFCSNSNPTVSSISPNSSSILWYDSANSSSPLSNTTTLLNNKKYYGTRKNGNCPESTDRLEITAHITTSSPAPLSVSSEFCLSENATLANISIMGQNIKWYANITDATTTPTTTLLQNDVTYYASQTVNGCESERTPIFVIVHDINTPTASSPQTFCIQETATVNEIAITGQNIKWYDALTNGALLSSSAQLQNGTTYYASQTINGCESDRIPILINIQNTAAPTGNTNQNFCSSQNPTLNTIVISGTALQWYNSTGSLLPNSTTLQDGITYYASQIVNGCESTTKLAISISLINTLPANNYSELFCDDLNDGSEKVNLSDYHSKIISNTSGYTFSYYPNYSAAENELVKNQIIDFSNFKLALGDNKIYVRINSNTPCYAISELKLTLLSKPQITIPDVVPICENNSITIDAGSGYDNYLWSTGATTAKINIDSPGNYSVTVTNNYSTVSCSTTKSFEVRKSNIATINSIDTQDWTDNQNTITVYATGAGDFEYSIDGIHFQDESQFTNLISGQYTVHVRDKNGCGTVTDEVYLLMYPKFFTPNGDGFNDSWKIKFSDLETTLSIKIFDRYGKLIKELTLNNSWDGTFNGQELPATDYWFIVTRANGNEYKGHFSLKR